MHWAGDWPGRTFTFKCRVLSTIQVRVVESEVSDEFPHNVNFNAATGVGFVSLSVCRMRSHMVVEPNSLLVDTDYGQYNLVMRSEVQRHLTLGLPHSSWSIPSWC